MTDKILGNGNKPLTQAEKDEKIEQLVGVFENFFDILGFDQQNDPNLKESPLRIAKMYVNEVMKGNFSEPPKITAFPNTKEYDQIVISGPIKIKSLCSHHLMPFVGHAHIGYIADKQVIGLSKLARITQFYMRRPQIQEELTQQIADEIVKLLEPKGVMVVISAQHTCMTLRGVEEESSWMETSAVRGAFKENASTRSEFFNLIRK